jgi:hypothetical protein
LATVAAFAFATGAHALVIAHDGLDVCHIKNESHRND